jgi:superoxide dismutase, Cu-Zn family
MKAHSTILASLALLFTAACSKDDPATAGPTTPAQPVEPTPVEPAAPEPLVAVAALEPRSGTEVTGTVTFTETNGTVVVTAEIENLTPPGPRGFHVHEVGDCSAEDALSAGGHFNPHDHPHGAPSVGEHHAGDLGNIVAGEDGRATHRMTVDFLTVSPGEASVVGRSVIVHAQADDLESQPTGDAGGRVACGIIELVE